LRLKRNSSARDFAGPPRPLIPSYCSPSTSPDPVVPPYPASWVPCRPCALPCIILISRLFSTLAFHHQHWDIRIPVASEPVNTAGLVTGQVRELSREHQFSLPISWISSINVTLQLDFARGRCSFFFFLGVRLRFRKLRLAARPHSAKTSTCTTSKEKNPLPAQRHWHVG
jgi:hypothetical protein